MNDPTHPSSVQCNADSVLDGLFEEITRQVHDGEAVDLEAYARKFPDQAEQIRRLLPAIQALADLGLSAVRDTSGGQRPAGEPISGCLGDFRILREIGRGGMGVVYEAEQISLGRRMALKVLPFAGVLDERQLTRFHNESRAAASLKHPNIVQVHSVGCERGVHYYAMEFIEGKTLAEVIAEMREKQEAGDGHQSSSPRPLGEEGPPLDSPRPLAREGLGVRADAGESPPDEAQVDLPAAETSPVAQAESSTQKPGGTKGFFRQVANWGIQAAEGLEHAHQLGIVHRDVKPSNLMVDGHGHLWITDFGLAQIQSSPNLTMTGDVLGTLRYMSPEQASGDRRVLDCRTDIYSLGVTLYELLTLRPAFPGDDRQKLLRQIVDEEAIPLRRLDRAIPRDLETIILKAIAKEPHARYVRARELAGELRRFLEDKPIRAKRPSVLERAGKWSRRHRSFVWSLAGFLFLVSMLSTTSALLISRQHAETVRQRDEAQRQRDEVLKRDESLRRQLYAADMRLARQAWANADLDQVHDILARHVPAPGQQDLRSFPWYYLRQECRSSAKTLEGHTDIVFCVAFSPDGNTLASGGRDRTIILWDPVTGQKRSTLHGPTDDVNFIAFSPDGKLMATAGEERVVRLWDAAEGHVVATLTGFDFPVASTLFTPDGKTLVVAEVDWTPRTVKTSLWDLATRRREQTIDGQRALAISADGLALLTGTPDGTVRILDLPSLEQLAERPRYFGSDVFTGVFTRRGDKRRPVAAGGRGGVVVVLYSAAGSLADLAKVASQLGAVRSVVVSPDEQLLACAGDDGRVRLLRTPATGVCYLDRILTGHSDIIWSAAFSPDGNTLATASSDRTIRLWRMTEDAAHVSLPLQPKGVDSAAFLDDGHTLVTAGGNSLVKFWDLATGQCDRSYELPATGSTAAIAPAAMLLAVGDADGTIQLRDLLTGSVNRTIDAYPKRVSSLSLSPDGCLLASLNVPWPYEGQTPTLKVWNVSTGEEVLGVQTADARDHGIVGAFSPDGRTFACLVKGDLQLWDLASKQARELKTGHSGSVVCVAWSPEGRLIATGAQDRSIKLFDAETLREVATLLGPKGEVLPLAFSPEGRTLVSGTSAEVRVWDVATAQELFPLQGFVLHPRHLAFSPDGSRLACCGFSNGGWGFVELWYASNNGE